MASAGAISLVTRLNKSVIFAAGVLFGAAAFAQVPYNPSAAAPRGPGRGRGPALAAKQMAPIDMTGYWVSIVTEDWKFRMVMPKKGNYSGVPLNAEGRKAADAWDPAKDEAAGQQCRAYGAAGLMRVPGRFHITWADDNTMKIEADSGTQTRLIHFGGKASEAGEPSWQGYSIGQWENAGAGRGPAKDGNLKVVTTHMLPAYLRMNGVPYSGDAVLTEYFDRISAPNGDEWLVVTTEVNDPKYLTMPFVTSTHFKKQADATGWMPQPCSAK